MNKKNQIGLGSSIFKNQNRTKTKNKKFQFNLNLIIFILTEIENISTQT